jgi:hypothetical protein
MAGLETAAQVLDTVAQVGGSFIQGGMSGDNGPGAGYVVDPRQFNMLSTLRDRAMRGMLGDMGGGTAFRQGQSNLAQMMADRGVRPDSGVYNAALANVATQAQQQDTQNLRDYMMGLANANVQTINTNRWIGQEGGLYGKNPYDKMYG